MHIENNISNKRISSDNRTEVLSGEASSNSFRPYSSLFYPYLLDNANIDKTISLTITRIASNKLDSAKTTWEGDPKDFLSDEFKWGFKETANPFIKNSNISNAFAFSKQRLRVYIEPKCVFSGMFNNSLAFAKTTLTVKGIDLFNGDHETFTVFDDFTSEQSDPQRYFNLTLPDYQIDNFNQYLLAGIYVVSIEAEYQLYHDILLTNPIEDANGIKQRHNLQILIFSAPHEATNVSSSLSVFSESPETTDSFLDLFSKSIFNDYNGVNSIPLSDEQKQAVIADQIAALFISQHPVVTSENYPSKIIGIGAEEKLFPSIVLDKAYTYAKRHPEIIPMVDDRLFNMLLSYKTFAFSYELDNYFTSFNQSIQKIRDPARIIAIDETGKTNRNFGVEGILFNPFVVQTVNAEIPKEADKEQTFSVAIRTKNVEITNFNISDPDFIDNMVITTLSPFDNNLLSCPSLNMTSVINSDPNAETFYVKSQNTDLFNNYPNYDEFNLIQTGAISSGQSVYALGSNPNVAIKFYSTSGCYFIIEGKSEGKTWKYKSQGYKLSGTYNLLSYSSDDSSPNPFPTVTSIVVLSRGDFEKSQYQYVPFSNDKINISFEPIIGEEFINRIRYSIWAKSTKSWMEYIDETGTTRSHTFDLSSVGGIGRRTINSVQAPCGVINAKIDIEDTYGFVNSFYQSRLIPDDYSQPSILSFSAQQSRDGTGSIDLFYNYIGRSEINNTKVVLEYSTGGQSWTTAARNLSGDIGSPVNPGFRKIKWNPWSEIPSSTQMVLVRLSIVDIDAKTDILPPQPVAISIDIRKPNIDVQILPQTSL